MTGPLSPLRVRTLADECYFALKTAILNLTLSPEAPLDEGKLAASLGISKTPVREALARLAGEGFVLSQPGRTSYVAPLSVTTIQDVYRVRIMLEAANIRDVAPHLVEQDLIRLGDLIRQAEASLSREDMIGFVDANDEFHGYLIQRSENRTLIAVAKSLFDQAHRIRAAIYRSEQLNAQHDLSARGLENHRDLLKALSRKDGERAARTMTFDIQMFLDAISAREMQEAFEHLAHPQAVSNEQIATVRLPSRRQESEARPSNRWERIDAGRDR